MNHPIRVVIVGRPNVGKSTLFNRLYGKRRALVHDEPGVTRDRLEEKTQWWSHGSIFPMVLVDTGGMGGDRFAAEIDQQVKIAVEQADIVLFVLDSKVGVTPLDEDLLRELNRSGVLKKTPTLAVVNKVDAELHEERIADFFSLGLEQVLTLSAEHGRGIDDLKIAILERFKDRGILQNTEEPDWPETDARSDAGFESENEPEGELSEDPLDESSDESEDEVEEIFDSGSLVPKIPRVAIVGKPNVGKSTLLNAVLGENRMITSPIAGTTVDSVDSLAEIGGKTYLFVDTAGIRRKSKTEQGVEVLSVVQTRKALENADIAILVLDGEEGIADQDEKIGGLIQDVGCSVILLMNKWDTQRKNPEFTKELAAKRIRSKMAYLSYAPIVFASAIRSQGLEDLGSLIDEILHQRQLKIPTHEFTEWVRKEATIHNPMNAKFFLCHQSGRNPPTFVCHVNDPDKVHFSLRRHFVNALRERWGYMGSPVRILFIEGKNRRSLPRKKKTGRKSPKVPV
jgi:GTP-binding protein